MMAGERNLAFRNTKALYPGRSVFDLSHEHVLTLDMGQLVPVMCLDMVPGDKFQISTDLLIRLQPLLAPVMHPINAYIHTFFCPYRILWPKVDETGNDWENFISGGVDGLNAAVLPRWDASSGKMNVGTLWDYFGFPVTPTPGTFSALFPDAIKPLDFPRRAYNLIFNEYYRDETLIAKVGLNNEEVLNRAWTKDYFTSALPWQQRGTAPAFPVTGSTQAVFSTTGSYRTATNPNYTEEVPTWNSNPASAGDKRMYTGASANPSILADSFMQNLTNNNSVDLSSAVTFDVADLRYAVQLQRWLERNARAGVRYTEFLHSHFGVSPRDDRLQRPEYVGGCKMPIIISEVLKTSQDGTNPQGNMAGHGISVDRQYQGSYYASEFGCMVSILSIMPAPVYSQGINREWLRTSKYDFFFWEFAHLSEQAILNQEIFLAGDGQNQTIFGYQGRYDEYRQQRSQIHGLMHTGLSQWHLARIFALRPHLNATFVSTEAASDDLKRIFAVTGQPGFIAHVGNRVRAVRPMPQIGEPGLMDH